MKNLQWRSLKTRVILITLAIFVLGVWSLTFYASRMLRQDMQRMLGEQQFSTVSLLASEVDEELAERLRELEKLAAHASPAMLARPAALQAYLEEHLIFQEPFNAGILAYRFDGTVIAEVSRTARPFNHRDMDIDGVAVALQEGKATIGRPVMGKNLQSPVFGMAVPIRDVRGQVIGALAGLTDLGQANFLDRFTQNHDGNTGDYSVVARQHRLIVASTDTSRVMNALPAPGVNPMIDRAIQGEEMTAVYRSSVGVERLASVKRVPAADWFIVGSLPTQQAFAPISAMQQRMLLTSVLLTLLAAIVLWWALKQQLSPMLTAAHTLRVLRHTEQAFAPLPIARRDEVGELMAGFNQLLAALGQREKALRETERSLKEAQGIAGVGSYVLNVSQGRWTSSEVFDQVFGIGPAHERTVAGWLALVHPEDRAMMTDYFERVVLAQGQAFDKVYRIVRQSDQVTRWVHGLGKLEFDAQGQPQEMHGTIQDISAHRQTEQYEQLRSRTLELIAAGAPIAQTLEALVRGVEQVHPQLRCSILLQDADGRHLHRGAAPSLPEFYNAAIEGLEVGLGNGSCGSAAASGERVIVENIQTHPYWVRYRALAERAGLAACWSQPIRKSNGRLLGTFSIYHGQPHSPAPDEILLVEQSAHLVSIAIEKQASAEQLRDSEARYRTLVEWSPEPILVHRLGTILYANPAAIHLFGARNAQELLGKSTRKLIHPDFLEQQMTRMQNIVDHVAMEPMVASKFLKLDGSPIDVEVQGTSIVFDGDEAIQVCLRDMTGRRQTEEKLQLAASVFSHAREGIMITAADGRIIAVNEAFSRITGYQRDEVLGRNPRILSSGRQSDEDYAAMWRALLEQGHWYGEIWNRRKNGEVYAEMQTISSVRDAQGQVQHYVSLFSDITANKEHQSQLEHIAHYDALTGLPNRLLLADRLQQAMAQTLRRGQRLAVAFLDLDGFKAVNDRHGHEAGDQLLIALATRMKQVLREGDTLARLGGDEFVVILLDLEDEAASIPMVERLLAAAAQPLQLDHDTLQVSASLGVTFYPQARDATADLLLRQADQAMYQAKQQGKNRYQVFSAE